MNDEQRTSKNGFKLDLSFLPSEDTVNTPPDSSRSSSERSDYKKAASIPKLNLSDISQLYDSSPRTPTSLNSPIHSKPGIPSLNLGGIGKVNVDDDKIRKEVTFKVPSIPPLALTKGWYILTLISSLY